MNELLKHRIYIKGGEIKLILNRSEYEDNLNAMDVVAENMIGGSPDSYVDKDYEVTLRFPMWKLDGSGNVVDFTDAEYETFRSSVAPEVD